MSEHKLKVKNTFDGASTGYGEKGCSFFDYFGEGLVERAKLSLGENILDIATGKGAVLFPAAKRVGPHGSAIGIDISPKMIEEATKKKQLPWIKLFQMDAEHLYFEDQSFDTVFCAFALFFFPHLKQALSESKRVLKPQGRFAVTTFAKKAALDLWIFEKVKEYGVSSKLSTVSLESPEALKQHLFDAGFSQVEIQEESKTFWHENAEEWWASLWTHSIRFALEQLSPADLERLKKEALQEAGSGKVGEERRVLYSVAKL